MAWKIKGKNLLGKKKPAEQVEQDKPEGKTAAPLAPASEDGPVFRNGDFPSGKLSESKRPSIFASKVKINWWESVKGLS